MLIYLEAWVRVILVNMLYEQTIWWIIAVQARKTFFQGWMVY